MTTAVATEEWKPKVNPWLASIPLMFGAFMFVLDETIANVALPYMAGSFSISRQESMWILTSYLIASGIVIPMVGWFSKVMGRKNFFMLSVLVFTVASFLCGIANSNEMMILCRILQGAGGGGILPIAQACLLENFEPRLRGKVMAMFGVVVVIAPIIGPVVGGWLTINWSWPFIYYINVPIGIITLIMTQQLLEDPPYARKQANVKTDFVGFIFLAMWLITLQVVLDKGNDEDWFGSKFITRLAIICVISLIAFIISQLKNKEPLVELRVLKDKNYLIGTFVQVIMQGVMLASMAILPQFLQSLMGYDAFLSGMTMMPRGVGACIALACCGALAEKVDNRWLVAFGLGLMGLAGWVLGDLNLQISSLNVGLPNFIFGLGMGFAMVPIIALSVITIPNEHMTNASGLQNLLKIIGGAIGTSIVATMLSRFSQVHQNMLVDNLTPLNEVYAQKLQAYSSAFMTNVDSATATYLGQKLLYNEMLQQSTLWAFIDSFRIYAVACIVIIPLVFMVRTIKK